jgi:hypothetical protein
VFTSGWCSGSERGVQNNRPSLGMTAPVLATVPSPWPSLQASR